MEIVDDCCVDMDDEAQNNSDDDVHTDPEGDTEDVKHSSKIKKNKKSKDFK